MRRVQRAQPELDGGMHDAVGLRGKSTGGPEVPVLGAEARSLRWTTRAGGRVTRAVLGGLDPWNQSRPRPCPAPNRGLSISLPRGPAD